MENIIKKIKVFSKGREFSAFVDEKDFPFIKKFKWCLRQGYARSNINGTQILMHHLIFGKPPKGLETDHINQNKLDNRRSNLRFVTSLQNGQNISNVKGARLRNGKWEANYCFNRKKYFKGGFKTKKLALLWRDELKRECTKNLYE